ncbi:DUF6048 family protein [Carboxylicivirga sp. N1Y90]|uniref:DUF6048 family protein n=1 Tax=Carboxylicivirga fragile TaxID=3417571 RepID=UPI003D341E16|nr:hypothetical protein [Marinilabiliaceae bacterium N1Y90]
MLKFILSLSLFFTFTTLVAQEETEEKVKEPKDPGLAIGINIGTFIIKAIEPERFGLEATARYKFNRKWFAVGEVGYEKVDLQNDPFSYTSDGSFMRLGADYNIFKVEEIGNNDNLILGLRYGVAVQEQENTRFTVKDGYWGNYTGALGKGITSSHWAEFVFGLRSEVLKNFYMGWTVRVRRLLNLSNENQIEPYAIPGYGSRDNTTNLSFTYNLEYHIPFKKK